jgi:hypothetical protein
MTYDWNAQFEGYPTGSNKGLVSGSALRVLKLAFKERFEVEHYFDETADAVCYHSPGECSVVELIADGELVASEGVFGALQYQGSIYFDNGSGMDVVAAGDHLYLEGTGDNDHSQYLNINGDELEGTLNVPSIGGLNTIVSGSELDSYVLSKGQHIGDDTLGGSKHPSRIIDNISDFVVFGEESLKIQDRSLDVVVSGGYEEVRMHDYCSFPRLRTAGTVRFYASEVDNDDYVGTFKLGSTTDGTYNLAYKTWEES